MALRRSPARPPISERPDPDLVEDLRLALRDLGVSNKCLPDLEPARMAIAVVQELEAEVGKRQLDISARVRRLSEETDWPMVDLLQDAVRYPDAIPYLPETPAPSCGECGEPIPREAALSLCDTCLDRGISEVSSGKSQSHLDHCTICARPTRGFLVYSFGYEWNNYCLACLEEPFTPASGRHSV